MMEENKQAHFMGHSPLAKGLKILLVLALILFVGVLTANKMKEYRYIGQSDQYPHTIAISGEGKVVAIPDIATINLGIITEKKDVASAQKENTEKMNNIIKELKGLGIEAKDIQTTNYYINPNYNWTQTRGQELIGYTVNQSVTVKIRDLDKIGEVLSKAASFGANQTGGLSFTVDEPEELKQQAREKALENAKEKAKSLAKIADVNLGKVVSFSESSNNYNPQPYYDSKALGIGGGGEMMAPAIEAGSMEIIVYVTVNYEIN